MQSDRNLQSKIAIGAIIAHFMAPFCLYVLYQILFYGLTLGGPRNHTKWISFEGHEIEFIFFSVIWIAGFFVFSSVIAVFYFGLENIKSWISTARKIVSGK